MKRILTGMAVILLAGALAYAKEFKKDGWVNASTFRVTGTGTIGEGQGAGTPAQRQLLACEAAQLHAEGRMIERLADAGARSVKGTVNEGTYKDGIKKKFAGTIRGGRIVYRSFDPKTNECEVVYEISEKNLRAKVAGLARKSRRR